MSDDRKAALTPLIRWMAGKIFDELVEEAKAEREQLHTLHDDPGNEEERAISAPPAPVAPESSGGKVRTQQRTRRKKTPTGD